MREQEIARLREQGLMMKEIAAKLGISINTVKVLAQSIRMKREAQEAQNGYR